MSILLDDRQVANDQPTFIIAEIAQAHDGSLGTLHAYIDAVADCGADAIKFQTHIAAAESTHDEKFRVKFSRQDATRFDYWKRMEFTAEQWAGIADHVRERGMAFMSSAFSVEAIELLDRLDVAAWKIASGETQNMVFMEAMADTGKTRSQKRPFLVSSGMSAWADIDATMDWLAARGEEQAVFQCTSRYPTALEDVGLNVLDEMKARYDCPVGLSDHSGQVYPALASMARGLGLLEVHAVFDRRCFGPDTGSSLTLDELKQVCDARDAFSLMQTNPVKKDQMADEMKTMRALFGRSLALAQDLPAGTVLTRDHILLKKPADGIPAAEIDRVLGKTLSRDASALRLLSEDDFY